MPVPTAVIGEAFGLAVALTVLVVGCAIDGTWWSLLTATCYIVALGIWAMFRPGCMPCVPTQTGFGVENAGCCGGELWSHWGAWLTAFFATGTFGVAFVMFHGEATGTTSFVTSIVSGLLVMALVVYEVKRPAIGGGTGGLGA